MDPHRRRRARLVAAIALALVLAGALAYTSFGAAARVLTPSQLARAGSGRAYQVTGTVLSGYTRQGTRLDFRLANRAGPAGPSVMIRYSGSVPDPFKAGREVIVTVVKSPGGFVGQPDSLVTKCPSKFAAAASTAPGA
jgi:cytochrome c-type biogenesis protein CcmE